MKNLINALEKRWSALMQTANGLTVRKRMHYIKVITIIEIYTPDRDESR